jgi:hypothetical protein
VDQVGSSGRAPVELGGFPASVEHQDSIGQPQELVEIRAAQDEG